MWVLRERNVPLRISPSGGPTSRSWQSTEPLGVAPFLIRVYAQIKEPSGLLNHRRGNQSVISILNHKMIILYRPSLPRNFVIIKSNYNPSKFNKMFSFNNNFKKSSTFLIISSQRVFDKAAHWIGIGNLFPRLQSVH